MRAAEGSRHSSSRGDKAGNSRSKSIKQRSKTSHRYAVFDKWAGTSLRTCLYTHTECTEGRPIFICSTENGPAFQQSPRVQPRSQEKCPPSVLSHPATCRWSHRMLRCLFQHDEDDETDPPPHPHHHPTRPQCSKCFRVNPKP